MSSLSMKSRSADVLENSDPKALRYNGMFALRLSVLILRSGERCSERLKRCRQT